MRCDKCPLWADDIECNIAEGELGLEHKDGMWGCKHSYNWCKRQADLFKKHFDYVINRGQSNMIALTNKDYNNMLDNCEAFKKCGFVNNVIDDKTGNIQWEHKDYENVTFGLTSIYEGNELEDGLWAFFIDSDDYITMPEHFEDYVGAVIGNQKQLEELLEAMVKRIEGRP